MGGASWIGANIRRLTELGKMPHLLPLAVFAGFVVLAAVIATLGRYEITQGAGAHFFVTDRWTGKIQHCMWIDVGHSICRQTYPPRPIPN